MRSLNQYPEIDIVSYFTDKESFHKLIIASSPTSGIHRIRDLPVIAGTAILVELYLQVI